MPSVWPSYLERAGWAACGLGVLLAGASVLALGASAQTDAQRKTEFAPFHCSVPNTGSATVSGYADATPPHFTNLGTHTWKITTPSPEAQQFFDQGLRLAYGFNHAEARRAFRQAQKLDPDCAMCFWGEAFVLGPNINVPMDPAANAPALSALAEAQRLAAGASPKERDLIAALAQRYSPDGKAERAKLDAAWADALGAVAAKYTDDVELAVLHAESLMDLQPWDYWTDGGKTPKGKAAEIVAQLERAMAKAPNHPGAIHFYIHAVEASDRPERAEAGADRLGAMVPGAGHLVHMPSHIYYRVGRYRDALETNKKAVGVDEAFIAEVSPDGPYPLAYYPHNVHFVLASAKNLGDAQTTLDAAGKLAQIISAETASAIPMVQPMMAAQYFAHAQFGTPESIAKLTVPAGAPPYVKAMLHYARGIGDVGAGKLDAAAREAAAIGDMEQSADFSDLQAAGIPGVEMLRIARHIIEGRIAQANGDATTAIAAFESAAMLQDGLTYMEPPYWYYPVRQSLGAAYLAAGRAGDAEREFQAALKRAPNSGWALYGLTEAAKAKGDAKLAADAEARLAKNWVGDRALLDLKRL
jgi:tetratricopeptide (TPR) repeat protein